MTNGTWKVCSICKKPIHLGQQYFVCSVTTCRQKRTGLLFCSLSCFEAHLPMMRHRDAWAEEAHAPTTLEPEDDAEPTRNTQPSPVFSSKPQAPTAPGEVRRRLVGVVPDPPDASNAQEVLVVVSKLKKFIRDRSGMNTSESVFPLLSRHLRSLCVAALRHAASDGRKTVMDRDFEAVLEERAGSPQN